MEHGSLVRSRMLAWIIDVLITSGINMILVGGFGLLLSCAYWLLKDGFFNGQGVGKRVMGLVVVVGASNKQCSFRESAIRNVFWLIPVLNIVMLFTGLHYLLYDTNSRHWGDRLADTSVIRAASSSVIPASNAPKG